MRIYQNPIEAVRETERDLYEMGIRVPVQTMQDKQVADNPDFETIEVRGYAFKIAGHRWNFLDEVKVIDYLFKEPENGDITAYIDAEFRDRIDAMGPFNPGHSYVFRPNVWQEFLHSGKFSYTYSERMTPQVYRVRDELRERPGSRQGIINIHGNVNTVGRDIAPSNDLRNMGGRQRIPCSMYYQVMIREGKVDLIYTMRSCDFLTHFLVDLMLATRLQDWYATELNLSVGTFTYFAGSMHAYARDMKTRGIF